MTKKEQLALDSIKLSDDDITQIKNDGRIVDNIKKMFFIDKNADPNKREDGIGLGEQMVLHEYALETHITEKQQSFLDDDFAYYVKHPLIKEKK